MRRALALTGLVPVLATSGLLATAAPASAATLETPSYLAESGTIQVTGARDDLERIEVRLTGPAASGVEEVATAGPGLRPGPRSVTVAASGVRHNGTYVAMLTSSSGSPARTTSLDVAEPPAAPAGVSAVPAGVGAAVVRWSAGSEPDLTGYRLLDGGTVVAEPGLCQGSCQRRVPDLSGGTHRFTVVAVRSCPTCGGGSLTAASAAGPVVVSGPPGPADPSAPPVDPDGDADGDGVRNDEDPTSGVVPAGPGAAPGTPGTPGASPGGFAGFGSALTAPGLLPPEAPRVAPPAAGPDTFAGELDYSSQLDEAAAEPAGPVDAALGPIRSALDSAQLMRTLAGALVLLLAAAHLRRWLTAAR